MAGRILGNAVSGVVAGAGLVTILASVLLIPTAQPARAAVGDLTDSAVTVKASDADPDLASAPMPDLEVTVSQTEDLVLQGVTVSWKGARPDDSRTPNANNPGVNYLDVFQCWGDDPHHPGVPDKETCEYAGLNSLYSDRLSQAYVDPLEDPAHVVTKGLWKGDMVVPFRSVDGTVVGQVADGLYTPVIVGNQFILNENAYFNRYTTNETYAKSAQDGTGTLSFEVQTGLESPGLGCGEVLDNGTPRSCWLVVVPRGTDTTANAHNALLESAWRHKVAVRLDFKPLGLRCPLGQAETPITGSELLSEAVSSWQPALCSAAGGATYTYAVDAESDAVNRLVNGGTGLAVTTVAADLTATGAPKDPLVYAPVGLGGVALAFSIDRASDSDKASPALQQLDGAPYRSLNLTPRLVAKLLTYSYKRSLPANAPNTHLGTNPLYLWQDPDFLAVNDPEWSAAAVAVMSDLLVPLGRSDEAEALWRYVLADDDARAFLAGQPDPWGMVVNPWYASTDATNAAGSAMAYPREDFPKADPSERPAANGAGVQTLIDWRPYTADFDSSAYSVLRGDKQTLGDWDPYPISGEPKWTKAVRDLPGTQKVMGVTLTSSAQRYQVRTVSLRNPAGQFVAPTEQSLLAAAQAFTPDPDQPQVIGWDPTSAQAKTAKDAYPLALPVYAAADPESGDAQARADDAAFVRYAATDGQIPGTSPGELPAGYAPLPAGWREQALAAADVIEHGWPAESPEPTPTATLPADTASTTLITAPPAPGQASVRVPAGTAPASAPPGSGTDPLASGVKARSLLGAATPADPAAPLRGSAVPVGVISGAAAVAAAPLIGRFRRPSRLARSRR